MGSLKGGCMKALMAVLAVLLTGCAGALRRENETLKEQLAVVQKLADDLKHDFQLCWKERGALISVYKEQGKKLADPKLKEK